MRLSFKTRLSGTQRRASDARTEAQSQARSATEPPLLHLWNPIEKPWKAMRASVLLTQHTAPEKKLSGRGSYALGSREEGANGHAALPAVVGTTLMQKITPVTRGTAPKSAPHLTIRLNFVKHSRIFAVIFSFFAIMVQNSSTNHFRWKFIQLFRNFSNF